MDAKLLIKHGFISNKETLSKYNEFTEGKPLSTIDREKRLAWENYLDEIEEKGKDLNKVADQEYAENAKDQWEYTGFPAPSNRYFLVYSRYNISVESIYYHIRDWLHYNMGYNKIDKVTDVFMASEQSSYFGSAQQRLAFQQDKVTQFLASIGKMIKDIFQIVRELRVLDERLALYEVTDSDKFNHKSIQESAEISLKGMWVDLVEQGSKNPASVYGMARELQFTTLPDLFFRYHPQTPNEIEKIVEGLEFNRKVKEVLKRKLRTYLEWKRFTSQPSGWSNSRQESSWDKG